MPSVADCLRQHGQAYLQQFGQRMPAVHRKVLSAIMQCRSGELGWLIYACPNCRERHWVGRSCGNRHCPACQHEKAQQWLAKQTDRLLPVHHFLVTVTVPDTVGGVLRAHQKDGYDALFAAGRNTICHRAEKSRYLKGCQLGFFGVLHTWGRDPTVYHPHVHFVVPGGGVSADGSQWQATPENFLFPHAATVQEYKRCFAAAMHAADLYDQVPAEAWQGKWVIDIKPVGNGQAVLKYLAPYVYRVAISDNRILACDDQSVTFRYTPSGSKTSKTRTVTGQEFLRGFLQHVLPSGYQKVRHFGWMSSNSRIKRDLVRWLVWLFLGWTYWLGSGHAPQPAKRQPPATPCPRCGAAMILTKALIPGLGMLILRSLPTAQARPQKTRGP